MEKKLFSLQGMCTLVMSMIMLLNTSNIIAQTSGNVDIGEGSGSTGSSATSPINQNYKNFRYQVIYTKAEIEAAGGVAGNLTQLGFKVQAGATALTNYTVSMVNTSASSLSSHVAGASQVFTTSSYSATSTGSYNMITLNNSFYWNGTNNILIDICYSKASTSSSGGSVYNFIVTAPGTRYGGNSSTTPSLCTTNTNYTGFNHKPQIRFVMQKAATVSCNAPTNLSVSSITGNSATLSWTASSPVPANGYEYARTTTNTVPTSAGTSTFGTSSNQTGLDAATSYYFWLRSKCNATTFSDWVGISFTTTCLAPTVTTTAGNRCGTGSVNLNASTNNGTVYWWDAATGGNLLGTGTTFNTPSISATTTFYASAAQTIPGNNLAQLGNGTKTSTIASQSPFHSANLYKAQSSNYLIKASELLGAGISTGYITSLSLDIASAGGTLSTFYIKMGSTNQNDLASSYALDNMQYYYGNNINGTTYSPTTGINTFSLSGNGFFWDGTSNVSVIIYWQNTSTVAASSVKYDDVDFYASRYQTFLSSWGTSYSNMSRPKLLINGKGLCMSNRVSALATVTIANTTYYRDFDGDGFGDPNNSMLTCDQPTGYVTNNLDCNDALVTYADNDGDGFGSQTKVPCNGVSNNTDCNDNLIMFQDLDNDGFGSTIMVACDGVLSNSDCDDTNSNVYRMGSFYLDADADGYSPAELQYVCYGLDTPTGYSLTSLGYDCDDTNAAANSSKTEICWNGFDDNCDGQISEGCAPIVVNMATANFYQLPSLSMSVAAQPYYGYPEEVKHYRFSIKNNQTGVTVEFISSIRQVAIPVEIRDFDVSYEIKASAVIHGELVPYAGNTITVFSPSINVGLVKLMPSTCGVTLDRLNATVGSTVGLNAISYTFRAKLSDDNAEEPTYYTVQSDTRHVSMTSFAGLMPQYNTSYSIAVSYEYFDVITEEIVQSNYGEECIVTMPNIPSIKLSSPTCGSTLPSKGTGLFVSSITSALAYEFRIRLTSDIGAEPIFYYTNPIANRYCTMASFEGLTFEYNTTYSVSAHYKIMNNGVEVWSDYGPECQITTPTSTQIATRTIETPFTAVAYPNPFANSFLLDIKTSYSTSLDIKVYDMLGRMIEQKQANVNELESTSIGSNYPSGVYNVIVTQDDESKAVRVVKR